MWIIHLSLNILWMIIYDGSKCLKPSFGGFVVALDMAMVATIANGATGTQLLRRVCF
jgi:hypothetical protein